MTIPQVINIDPIVCDFNGFNQWATLFPPPEWGTPFHNEILMTASIGTGRFSKLTPAQWPTTDLTAV